MDSLKLWLQRILGRYSYAVVELYYFCRYQLLYRGDKLVCPCCSSRLKKFLPLRTHSGTLTPSVICPRCDAHPRHRLLWQYLRAEQGDLFTTELQFLHLAPEFCFTRHFRKLKNLHYVTADLKMPQVDCRADVCCLPFADNSFDVLFCNHVLEHIPADREAMSELFRILRSTGWALLQVPIDKKINQTLEDESIVSPDERERLFGQNDHVRQYGADYQERLSAAGFAVEVIEYPVTLNPSVIEECGLDPDESIYLCHKSSDAVKPQGGLK